VQFKAQYVAKVEVTSIVYNELQPFDHNTPQQSTGTAFLMQSPLFSDPSHLIFITAYHVIANPTGERNDIRILISGFDKPPAGRVIGICPHMDIALVEVELTPEQRAEFSEESGLPQGNSDAVTQLDKVLLVGCARGSSVQTTSGIISGRFCEADHPFSHHRNLLQCDAVGFEGNSGGPLISYADHKVQGVLIAARKKGDIATNSAMLVVPINEAMYVFNQMMSKWRASSQIAELVVPIVDIVTCRSHRTIEDLDEVDLLQSGDHDICYISYAGWLSNFKGAVLHSISYYDVVSGMDGNKYHFRDIRVDPQGDVHLPHIWPSRLPWQTVLGRVSFSDKIMLSVTHSGGSGMRTMDIGKDGLMCMNKCRVRFPELKVDAPSYIVVGGILMTHVSINHVLSDPKRFSRYVQLFQDPATRKQSVVAVSHIFGNSCIIRTRLIHVGDTIRTINRKEIVTLDDIKNALQVSKSVVVVELDNRRVIACPYMDALASDKFAYSITRGAESVFPLIQIQNRKAKEERE